MGHVRTGGLQWNMQVTDTIRPEHMTTFMITMVQDEDGMFIVECPAIPGCVSQGTTEDEREDNIRSAIRACLAVRRELRMPLRIRGHQLERPV
jgi:predicted RNase H-like HicB family nuclease